MPYLQELQTTYNRILSVSHLPTRKLLLDSFRCRLLQLQKTTREECPPNEKQQITTTNYTNTSTVSEFSQEGRILPGSLTGNDELVELEECIVEKQQKKISLNEQIEELEEQYLWRQEEILQQQERVYKLQKEIARKSYEIGRRASEKKQEAEDMGQSGSFASKMLCLWF